MIYQVCDDRKIGFRNWSAKIAVLWASVVVTYYIKLFRTGPNRQNGILMSLLFFVEEAIKIFWLFDKFLSNCFSMFLCLFYLLFLTSVSHFRFYATEVSFWQIFNVIKQVLTEMLKFAVY